LEPGPNVGSSPNPVNRVSGAPCRAWAPWRHRNDTIPPSQVGVQRLFRVPHATDNVLGRRPRHSCVRRSSPRIVRPSMTLHLVCTLLAWQQPAQQPADGDRRYDRVTCEASRPAVADVTPLGHLTARAAGRATITAAAGKASESWTLVVLPNPVVRLSVAPADTAVRAGDVVRFAFVATDVARKSVGDARPEWAVSPVGQGYATVDGAGVFVADQPGTYRVIATLGARSAEAFVQVAARNVTRQVTIVGRLPLKGLAAAELWLHPDGK